MKRRAVLIDLFYINLLHENSPGNIFVLFNVLF